MDYADKLTRDKAVFVLVDFRNGFFPGTKTIDHDRLRRNAEALPRLSELSKMRVNRASIVSEIMKDWQTAKGPQTGKRYQDFSYWGNRN